MAKLFFSYSHKDETLRNELEVHLSLLKRQGIIETWHDRKIDAGKEFNQEICEYLSEADIILLLVSPYFLASDYCYNIEMTTALKMHERGESVVIPVILHPCDWHTAPFGKLTAVPIDGKPISKYSNQHEAYLEVTKAIRELSSKYTKANSTSPGLPRKNNFYRISKSQKKKLDNVLNDIFHFVCNDQIPESGGWGGSHAHVFKYSYGTSPSSIDLREGGIGSTFLALRSLLSAGAKINSTSEVGRKVLKYLLDRQDHTGGFGRFSKTRSGEEIHTSYRHTGLAVMIIIMLDGPSQMVLSALDYIDKLTKEDVLYDSAPSISCAALLLCFEWLISTKWSVRNLTSEDRDRILLITKKNTHWLRQELIDAIKSPRNIHPPLWIPYGKNPKHLFYTAVITIDLCCYLDNPPFEEMYIVLQHMASYGENGLPYDPSQKKSDVGMSFYFSAVVLNPRLIKWIKIQEEGYVLIEKAINYLDFSISNWKKSQYMNNTFVDTVGNALLFRESMGQADYLSS